MTGMRLWMGATTAFASVVMIVKLSSGVFVSGSRQLSHSPAKQKGALSGRWNRQGSFFVPSFRHS